jgi:membrane protein required for colicin V production
VHIFDIVCGCVALIFIILGIKRGLVEEVGRVAAVVGGFFAALSLYRQGATYLRFLRFSDTALSIIAFLIIFLVCLFAIALIGVVVKKIVHFSMLGWADRLCGGLLGFVKVFFIVWIVVIAVASLPFDRVRNWFKPSISYSFFVAISPVLRARGLMPAHGPVQDILKANPVPAITRAIEAAAAGADSALRKQEHNASVKPTSKPAAKAPAR